MVLGENEANETSEYIYNGLGHLVGNTWTIKPNSYGYTNTTSPPGHMQDIVAKIYTLDYTSPLNNVILEQEDGVGDLTYRYVYGLQKLSAVISPVTNSESIAVNGEVKVWYHHDRLGTTDFLTDNVMSDIRSYVSYDDWGQIESNVVLQCGVRELDLVMEYTGHPYDAVLEVYYARARMYDAGDRRFMAVDVWAGTPNNPQSLNRYVYCADNPLRYVDLTGEKFTLELNGKNHEIKNYLLKDGNIFVSMLELSKIFNKAIGIYSYNNRRIRELRKSHMIDERRNNFDPS